MPQRSVAANYTFEQQRQEINLLAADFWTQKTNVDNAASTYLKHDGSNDFTGGTLAVPAAFTINSNGGAGTLTISGNLQVTGTTTTVNTATLDVTDKNITIAKGVANDAAADGAGVTIDSSPHITWNFVDAKDAWVSSIGVEGSTFVAAPYGHFKGSGTPTTGQGVEVNAPDGNTGQVISYDRTNSAYKELRLKGSSVGVYTGTTNALRASFNSNGIELAAGDFKIPNDTGKVTIGQSEDLQLFHDGGSSIIRNINNNASLYLQASSTGTNNIKCIPNSGTQLFWNGVLALYTAEDANNAGVPTVRIHDDVKLKMGNSSDFEIYHAAGGNSYIKEGGGGALVINADDFYLQNNATTTYLRTHSGGAIDLNYNGSKVLETADGSLKVSGSAIFENVAANEYNNAWAAANGKLALKGDLGGGNYFGWREKNVAAGSVTQANAEKKLPSINDFTYPNSSSGMLIASTSKIGFAASGESPQFSTGVTMLFDGSGLAIGGTRAFDCSDSVDNATTAKIKLMGSGKLSVGTTNTNSTLTISSGASANAVSIRNTTGGNGNVGVLFSTQDHSGGREKAAIYHQEMHGQAHYGGDFIFCLANSTGDASQVAPSDERMRINRFGEVFIGDSTANTTTDRSTLLSVSGTHQDPGGVWTQVGIYSSDGQAEGKGGSIGFGGQDGSTTKQQFASIIGSKENGTSGNYAGNLKFYTRPNGAVSTQALRITSEQSIVATRPGPLSYGSTENYLVFNFDDEASVLDGNSNFNTHRVFTAGRTGPFRITCSMKIDSGPYYFVYDVYNSRTGQKLNADGASSTNCRWTDNLASGEGSSVHGFRRFTIPCNADGDGVRPGDNIELRMGSSDSNGNLVAAPGSQNTRCKNFRVYSTVPMKEDGGLNYHPCPAAFHVVMGGQNKTFGQNDYLTWETVSFQRGHVVANENNAGSSTATKGFDLNDNSWKVPYTGIYAFYLNMFCNVDSDARVALTIDGTAYQSGYIWGINSNEGNATPNQAGFQTLFLGAGSVIKVQCTTGSVNSTYGGHTSWGGFLVG